MIRPFWSESDGMSFRCHRDPPPEVEYSAQAHTVMGQWLAEAGYLEAATSLLLTGLEHWSKTDTEEDDRAAACAESLAKVPRHTLV